MVQVSQKDLSFGNVGGVFWTQVKTDPLFKAPFSTLKKAALWSDEGRFKEGVWSWLCAEGEDWTVEATKKVQTQEGDVFSVQLDVGDKKERLLWGPMGALLKSRSLVDVILVEVSDMQNPLAEEVVGAIAHASKSKGGVQLMFWGNPDVIGVLLSGSLTRMMGPTSCLAGYRLKKVTVFPRKKHWGPELQGS